MARKKKQTQPETRSEVDDLRRRLTEAHRHRDLLIQALHGLATSQGGLAMGAGEMDNHARYLKILNKLIQALMEKNYPLPITAQTKISDLSPNTLPIVRLINETFFPDNRFTTGMIANSDTLQIVSLRILHLNPSNV